MPTVEDYFDDDTDFPLPSSSKPAPLPHTGEHGALLQEIGDDDDFDFGKLQEQGRGIFGEDAVAPVPSVGDKGKAVMRGDDEIRPSGKQPEINPNTPMGGFMGDMMKLQAADEQRMEKIRNQFGNVSVAADPAIYKEWHSVYPIYFDAKVSLNAGRRVPRTSAVWWPLATHISMACRVLGLPSVLEPNRCHPADWENPGRVKVQFLKDGKFLNPIVQNRSQLYKHLAEQIRDQDPSITFNPSTTPSQRHKSSSSKTTANANSKTTTTKSKQGNSKTAAKVAKPSVPTVSLPTRTPLPPYPLPAIDDRLPLHSPVVSAGVAVAAIKREKIEGEKEKKLDNGGNSPAEGKQPKMKRMVVRGKR